MLWDTYNLFRGDDFGAFWKSHLTSARRRLLFIVGAGFDARVLGPVRRIIDIAPQTERRCIAINLSDGYTTNKTAHDRGKENARHLHELFGKAGIEIRYLKPIDGDGIRNVALATQQLLHDLPELADGYTDVIVDISALPRLVYLPIINQLLHRYVDFKAASPLGAPVNVHVTYAESPAMDAAISKLEIDTELAPLGSLGIRLDEEKSLNWPIVWFPVLAEEVSDQIIRIHERTNPSEICPVLPAQCGNPRRPDDIIHRLGEQLFDRFSVDNRDILRATEWNPFQLYRNLLRAMARYEESLMLFGGTRFVISPLSSKGLSIGCLLAAFEKRHTGGEATRVGMCHIESRRFEIATPPPGAEYTVMSAWLTGECYRERAPQNSPATEAKTRPRARRAA